MRSIYDNCVVQGFVAVGATQSSVLGYTATGPSVDTKGYNTGALRVYLSTVRSGLTVNAGGSLTAVLQESADNVTFTTATDNAGTTIGFSGTQATTTAVISDDRIEGIGLSNRMRYLRVVLTQNFGQGASSANIFTGIACIELGRAYSRPVTTTVSNT